MCPKKFTKICIDCLLIFHWFQLGPTRAYMCPKQIPYICLDCPKFFPGVHLEPKSVPYRLSLINDTVCITSHNRIELSPILSCWPTSRPATTPPPSTAGSRPSSTSAPSPSRPPPSTPIPGLARSPRCRWRTSPPSTDEKWLKSDFKWLCYWKVTQSDSVLW